MAEILFILNYFGTSGGKITLGEGRVKIKMTDSRHYSDVSKVVEDLDEKFAHFERPIVKLSNSY